MTMESGNLQSADTPKPGSSSVALTKCSNHRGNQQARAPPTPCGAFIIAGCVWRVYRLPSTVYRDGGGPGLAALSFLWSTPKKDTITHVRPNPVHALTDPWPV